MRLHSLKCAVSLGISLAVVSAPYLSYNTFPDGTTDRVFAESGESETFTWSLDEGVLTISGSGKMSTSSLNIPWNDSLDGITSVVIENGITTVGSFAFRNCSNLVSVTLPDTVTSIEKNAFKGCSSLTNISFPVGLKSIDRSAFTECSAIQEVSFPNTLISIGESAFEGCGSLKKALIPDSVSSIGDYAFDSCSSDLVICCAFGSAAYSYAKANGLQYDDSYSFERNPEDPMDNPDSDTYTISSTRDLKALSTVIGKYSTISLEADIAAPSDWTPVEKFNGTFNGNGHKIKGLTDSLFRTLESEAKVHDLTLYDIEITKSAGGSFGAIACANRGTIDYCKVSGSINCEATRRMDNSIVWLSIAVFPRSFSSFCAGGIAGTNSGTIENCTNTTRIDVTNTSEVQKDHGIYYACAGGMAGENTGMIKDCTNTGNVYADVWTYSVTDYDSSRTREGYTAAICGGMTGFNMGTVSGCQSVGVYATNENLSGGVYTDSTTKDAEASYDNEPAMYAYAGGIAGATTGSISQCAVSSLGKQFSSLGTRMYVTAPKYTPTYNVREVNMWCGGIAGAAFGGATIDQCSNRLNPRVVFEVDRYVGTMNEHNFCGGILGAAYYQDCKITNCYNWGTPTATEEFAAVEQVTKISGGFMHGGIVGGICNSTIMGSNAFETYKGSATISNCYSIAPASKFRMNSGDTYIYNYALINENTTLSSVTANASFTNCYYIDSLSGQYGTPKSGDEMKTQEFAALLGDAFAYKADDYPVLVWETQRVRGDVNADGYLTVADVVLLQKWLLADPNTHLANWKAGDFYEDDKLDVLDLALLKRELLKIT